MTYRLNFGCGVKLFKIENLPQTVFPKKSIKRFGTLKWSQEGENSVRYSQTIDLPYTKRRRFPDQQFGLGGRSGTWLTIQSKILNAGFISVPLIKQSRESFK